MGSPPQTKVWHPPHPYPLESCPFHSTLPHRSWLWFILFDVRIYMMPNYKVLNGTINHRQLSPLLKHTQNQIDGGDFALSSSPRLITIYTSCKWGQNWGHYIPLPLGITPSSVFHYIYTIHIQFAHQNFKIADLPHVQSSTLNVHDQAARLPCTCPVGSQLPADPEV